MCLWFSKSFTLFIYFLAINFFGLFLRLVSFQDYFECFVCKEMNSRKKEYDYIVVGSGSAGSIIVQRLTEDKNIQVLLIEAGSYGNGLLDIPSIGPLLQNSVFDWQYRTVPQKKACLGLENKVSNWPMGKIVGGTSMLNNMVYNRGHPDDFLYWYKDKTDFNYNLDILPYFRKTERFNNNDPESSMIISEPPFLSNISRSFLKAAECAKLQINNDGLESQPGFSIPKATLLNGRRFTSWHRLSKVKKSRNLTVISNSIVEKVLFKDNYEAYGVRYMHLDEYYEVTASKGVILAAGVIGTPKILMLSGIGPKEHLKNIKVTPILDLPVGNNLQDHVTTGFDLILLDAPPDVGISSMLSPCSAFKYFKKSKGPWTSTGCEGIAFFSPGPRDLPDLQFMILPLGVTSDDGVYLRTLVGISETLWKNYFDKIQKPAITILPIVLHPRSRGTVRLRDKHVKSAPLIDPNYLSHSYDVDVLIRGIEEIKNLIETNPLQELGARLNNITFPGCEEFTFDTRPYWECYVRHLTITSYHPVGTCKFGEVVDYNFQVKGTSKLFVVDGSILPSLPSGNPNAAIMMMAEKASEQIKYHRWLLENKSRTKEIFVEKTNC